MIARLFDRSRRIDSAEGSNQSVDPGQVDDNDTNIPRLAHSASACLLGLATHCRFAACWIALRRVWPRSLQSKPPLHFSYAACCRKLSLLTLSITATTPFASSCIDSKDK